MPHRLNPFRGAQVIVPEHGGTHQAFGEVGYKVRPAEVRPAQFAPLRFAPRRFAPLRSAPARFAPVRSPPVRFVPLRFALPRFAPRRSARTTRSGNILEFSPRHLFQASTPCLRILRQAGADPGPWGSAISRRDL